MRPLTVKSAPIFSKMIEAEPKETIQFRLDSDILSKIIAAVLSVSRNEKTAHHILPSSRLSAMVTINSRACLVDHFDVERNKKTGGKVQVYATLENEKRIVFRLPHSL